MRARADLIVFWVPRELSRMPAFTTNIEFGEDYDSCRCLYGRPAGSPKNRYLDVRWQEVSGGVPHTSLRDLLTEGVDLVGKGALRRGAERDVPIGIWRSPAFTSWYDALRASGHVLRAFRLRYALPLGKRHPASPVLGFLTEAALARAGEDRVPASALFLAQPEGVIVLPN